jgi:hypothetical protein
MKWSSKDFYHVIQNNIQFKTYESFVSAVFHLVFSDLIWSWVNETGESKSMYKGRLLYAVLNSFV